MAESMNAIHTALVAANADRELAEELYMHMAMLRRRGDLSITRTYALAPGEAFGSAAQAGLVLLLISPSIPHLDRMHELLRLLEDRHREGKCRVIPVLLAPGDYDGLWVTRLQALPRGRAVAGRKDRDEAWAEVVGEIKRILPKLAAAA